MIKKSLLFVALISAITISSCKKDNETEVTASASLSVKVDGKAKKNSEPVIAAIYQSQNSIQIIGKISDTEGITLSTQKIATGEYDLALDENTAVYLTNTNDPENASYLSTAGTLKITSISDTEVVGTFNFTGQNFADKKVSVTEGSFRARVTKI